MPYGLELSHFIFMINVMCLFSLQVPMHGVDHWTFRSPKLYLWRFVMKFTNIIRGVDKLILVNIYLPGCPLKPEAIIDAITKLRKKVAQKTYGNKTKFQWGNRYSTLKPQFHFEPTIHTWQYNEQLNNQFSKYQLNSTLGIPLQIIEKEKGLISYQKNKNERRKDIQKKEGKK